MESQRILDRDAVKRKIAALLKVPSEKIAGEALLTDLVSDSFVLVDLVIELQEEFGCRLSQEHLKEVRTVDDLVYQLELHVISL